MFSPRLSLAGDIVKKGQKAVGDSQQSGLRCGRVLLLVPKRYEIWQQALVSLGNPGNACPFLSGGVAAVSRIKECVAGGHFAEVMYKSKL